MVLLVTRRSQAQDLFLCTRLNAKTSLQQDQDTETTTSTFLSQIANTTLRWETVTQGNVGLDFRIVQKAVER